MDTRMDANFGPPRRLLVIAVTSALLLAACVAKPSQDRNGGEAGPATATPASAVESEPPSPPSPVSGGQGTPLGADESTTYRHLVDTTMMDLNQLTRLLGALSLDVGRSPDAAVQERQLLQGTTDTFRLVQARLDAATPPTRYEKLHMHLKEAVTAYIQAAETLEVEPATEKFDHRRFQELMLQGGKNVHAAAGELSGL
ncbi:MAG: hypothetical protein HY678_03645 [Chloroflexi bacterium]|nr:hypothetical protein [Chloroflexota bacterium]